MPRTCNSGEYILAEPHRWEMRGNYLFEKGLELGLGLTLIIQLDLFCFLYTINCKLYIFIYINYVVKYMRGTS